MKIALITGITGQDGSYLAELLLEKGYRVHGTIRPSNVVSTGNLAQLCSAPAVFEKQLFLHEADLRDSDSLYRVLAEFKPEEFYHLAGQTHVGKSYDAVEETCELAGMGTLRILEMLKRMNSPPRFFHASSSEIFGRPKESPQTETTPIAPVNPYGCAKAFATQLVQVYRETHGLFAVNGILYNHESPRRGENFVTRKICRAAAAIKLGRQQALELGDTSALRDWGHARDYVRGMWMALNHKSAEDYIFATGQLHSVQQVVERAFEAVDLDWKQYVRSDSSLYRKGEPSRLVGNPTKSREVLGWQPEIGFDEIIREMTRADLEDLTLK